MWFLDVEAAADVGLVCGLEDCLVATGRLWSTNHKSISSDVRSDSIISTSSSIFVQSPCVVVRKSKEAIKRAPRRRLRKRGVTGQQVNVGGLNRGEHKQGGILRDGRG